MLHDELYKSGFSQPYLRCVEEEEAKYVMEEVHEGICGDHMRAKSLCPEDHEGGLFLAHNATRCNGFRQKM